MKKILLMLCSSILILTSCQSNSSNNSNNTFTVTWLNYDGSILELDKNVPYGTMPSYDGKIPEKEQQNGYKYIFSNWSPEIEKVTRDITYVAQFSFASLITFTITWMAGDKILEVDEVPAGSYPYYLGETPTQPSDYVADYRFNGCWYPSVDVATDDRTYYAQFDTIYKYDIDFGWNFVGSANRYGVAFITRRINGNRGFDFDVNLYVENPDENNYWKAKYLRTQFYLAIQKVFKKYGYQDPEDRTSVIRVKMVDKKDSKIIHSIDFAIFQDIRNADSEFIEKYARKYDNGSYGWTTRGGKNNDALAKLTWLNDNIGDSGNDNYKYWYGDGLSLLEDLRQEYLKLKNNNNDEEKCSFQLFNEAINNIYNQWQQWIKK